MPLNQNITGSWSSLGQTQTAGTAIVIGIDPYLGPRETGTRLFAANTASTRQYSGNQAALTGIPNWWGTESMYTHVTDILTVGGNTAHTLAFMRPKNWTYLTSATAANNAILNLKEDPGVYSLNYRYPMLNTVPVASVADNNIANTDYLAYQLNDGTWIYDKVSSVGAGNIAITMTTVTPNVASGGAAAGTAVFFFGAVGDKDPATGKADPGILTGANQNVGPLETFASLANSLHRGDPIMFFDANATGADIISLLAGVYSKDW